GAEAERIAIALAAARQRLGDAAYVRAQVAGESRTLEEAADQAMHLLIEHGDGSQVPGGGRRVLPDLLPRRQHRRPAPLGAAGPRQRPRGRWLDRDRVGRRARPPPPAPDRPETARMIPAHP